MPTSTFTIRTLGIPTSNRPAEVKDCLLSAAEHLERHGRGDCEIVIVDNSPEQDKAATTRELLGGVPQDVRARVRYGGFPEKREFLVLLEKRGLPMDVIQFALEGSPRYRNRAGANRNALLIDCAGLSFVSCDDDVRWTTLDLRAGDQSPIVVANGDAAVDTSFYPDRGATEAAAVVTSEDIIAAHEQILGKTPFAAPSTPPRRDAERLGVKGFVDAVNGDGRVRLTMSGVLGDCGMPSDAGFLLSSGTIRTRYKAAWTGAGSEGRSREVIRGVTRPVIGAEGTVVTTTLTGFDNVELLPPFLPCGLGDDILFGCILGKVYEDRYLGYVPFALPHGSGSGRRFNPLPVSVNLPIIVITAIEATASSASGRVADRMAAIGKSLVELASVSQAEFDYFIARRLRLKTAGFVHRLMSAPLDDAPASWKSEIQQWAEQLQSQVETRGPITPADFGEESMTAEDSRQHAREFVRRYGLLLEYWPSMVEQAVALRNAGITLARPIALHSATA